MSLDPITAGIDLGTKLLDKFVKDPAQRDAAKLEMLKAKQNGELEEIRIQMSAILAEASSDDPFTSRARPSFLYVVYILILASLPMGVLYAFSPTTATEIATGFRLWLESIPESIIDLFTFVMLGYIGGRSYEKVTKLKSLK